MSTQKLAPPSFEKAMSELDSLVLKMEAGDLSLEDSLRLFERGVELTRHCHKALAQAQLKVDMLTQDNDPNNTVAFDAR